MVTKIPSNIILNKIVKKRERLFAYFIIIITAVIKYVSNSYFFDTCTLSIYSFQYLVILRVNLDTNINTLPQAVNDINTNLIELQRLSEIALKNNCYNS